MLSQWFPGGRGARWCACGCCSSGSSAGSADRARCAGPSSSVGYRLWPHSPSMVFLAFLTDLASPGTILGASRPCGLTVLLLSNSGSGRGSSENLRAAV